MNWVYPIKEEYMLQTLIRDAQEEEAKKTLCRIMKEIRVLGENSIEFQTERGMDLLTLMGRAAIDGGAKPNRVFGFCRENCSKLMVAANGDTLVKQLSCFLSELILMENNNGEIRNDSILRKTEEYLRDHLSEKITLDDAADNVHLSRSSFCKAIREATGCSFTVYLNHVRLEQGKKMLLTTNLSISEIASDTGYKGQAYFSRLFRKHYGQTPLKYRMNNKGELYHDF